MHILKETIKFIIAGLIILIALGYTGQIIKAKSVIPLRQKWNYDHGYITKEVYDHSIEQNTFIHYLFNPKLVLSVD